MNPSRPPASPGAEADVTHSVATRTVRGGAVTAATTWLKFLLQFGSTLAIARLIGPFEYGVAAIVVVFGGAAEILRNSGFTVLAIRRTEMDSAYASRLHRQTMVVALVAAAVVGLSGQGLARAFNDSRYVVFAPVLGLIFVFIGLGSLQAAMLARDLRFRQVAIGDLVAAVVACTCAVALAIAGAGAWALVVQPVLMALVQTIMVWILSPWRPRRSTSRMIASDRVFVRDITTVNVFNYFAGNLDNVLVGYVAGPLGAGLYVQAYQLMILPLQQITGPLQKVMVPALSRVRSESDRFRAYYRTLLALVTLVLWPFYIVMLIFRVEVIEALFGEAWLGAAPILAFLVIAGIVNAAAYPTTWLFIVSGQSRRQLCWVLATRPIIVGSFVAGIPWGVVGVAAAFALVNAVLVVPEFLLARRAVGLRVVDFFAPLARPALLAVVAGLASFATRAVGPPSSSYAVLAAELVLTGVAVVSAAALVPAIRREFSTILSAMRAGKKDA
ncbi:lipopolysaccharide biosynthesis protein [Actinomycetospora lutea]|uniref:lipopolysaccharide biosynthesis protein n=1 Tax=Actinomycetospora lutea TaxID=663604 RepID=UPI002365FCDE|nr:lipopolysaccharide biosynthesis protein [Actinomycetospora lutea]MDD7941981.1 lipopolysaccharide biosynthesis protein [Actinomycetospora lutea]